MNHTLIVSRDPDPELMPDAEIECHGVTDACAEWTECRVAECPGNTGQDDTLWDVSDMAHGVQHRYIYNDAGDFWGVRSGGCYAMNRNDADAQEFAEEHNLGSGRYAVDVEIDDSTVIITLATALAA